MRRWLLHGLIPVLLLSALVFRTAHAGVINNVLIEWRAQVDKCEDPTKRDIDALVNVAMFDAINAIAHKYKPYALKTSAIPGSSMDAAAAKAAHDVLIVACPDMASGYDGALKASLALIADTVARNNGAAIGKQAAAAVIAARVNSKTDGNDPFMSSSKVGVYVPTLREVGMGFAHQHPWVMTKPDELRPPPPPALSSAVWARDLNEIKSLGGKKSKTRTAAQTDDGKFWGNSDVRRVLRQLIGLPGRSLVDDARFLALAEMAWVDTYVSMMDGKYAYNFWRPVTAIRGAASDGNDSTTADAEWEPLLNTPPHPEYPCGHCMSAAAVGTVINLEFGKRMPTIVIDSDSSMLRRLTTAQEYIDDVGEARMLGGVHYRNSINVGKAMGVSIGTLAVHRFFNPARK
ncbi:MAG: vanadium-dependent haloperoxidase [Gemmatimonadaceae bacterium]